MLSTTKTPLTILRLRRKEAFIGRHRDRSRLEPNHQHVVSPQSLILDQ